MVVVVVWPSPNDWCSLPGTKVYEPSGCTVNVPPPLPGSVRPPEVIGRPLTDTTVSGSPSGSESFSIRLPRSAWPWRVWPRSSSALGAWLAGAGAASSSAPAVAPPRKVRTPSSPRPGFGYARSIGVVLSRILARRTKLLPALSPLPPMTAAVGSSSSNGSRPSCRAASRRSESVVVGRATAASEASPPPPFRSGVTATSRPSPITRGMPPSTCRATVEPEAVTMSLPCGTLLPSCNSVSEPSLLRIQARPVTAVTTAGEELAMAIHSGID
ncbi:Uncharacterised protein [Mycobacteroides abscessus subsp. abscessus]|nr:hypothetical protein DK45_3059 [Bordetella bronchiseptica]SHR56955.1 Uncharacterised protein [Mycobacteroides abscessus subsp. abscessus]